MSLWKLPSLSALRAFEAAARHQSYSKAAQELNVTHAAIGQHVRSLEAELSQTLMIPQGRGVAVTAAGGRLADYLRQGFASIAEGVDILRAEVEARPLNISTTPAFTSNWLMPRIGDFWAHHPDIDISINPSFEIVDLKAGGFDMAIRYGDGNWPGLDVELLTDGNFWVVGPPAMIADNQIVTVGDTQKLPWIMENYMMERSAMIEHAGIALDDLKLRLLNTTGMVLSAVKSGLGVTAQPRSVVEDLVKSGQLTFVGVLRHQDLGYYMVTLPDRNPRGVSTFKKWLRQQAADQSHPK